jgi:hypothetical protein
MNVRFAETCREKPLELLSPEQDIQNENVRDGRTQRDILLKCEQDIFIGVFFDGTNNNKFRDTSAFSHSNVARLYEVYPGTPAKQTAPTFAPRVNPDGSTTPREVFADQKFQPSTIPDFEFPYYRKIYVPGVGTPMPDVGDSGTGKDKQLGLGMAYLGQARLDWALLQLCNQVHAALFKNPLEATVNMASVAKRSAPLASLPIPDALQALDQLAGSRLQEHWDRFVYQMGRYDTSAFNSTLADYEQRLRAILELRGRNKPDLRKIRLSVFGFSRGAAMARAWVSRVNERWASGLAGIALQIDFLGLFDTVASVGLAQSVPRANGHFAWADGNNMAVPGNVKRCVHLAAAFEVRGSFPLDSVSQSDLLPSNCKEILYPGVHSDVGGGYPPGDQGRAVGEGAVGDRLKLSQIPLAQMYREARMAGVPLAPASAMRAYQQENFAIDPQLRADFNAYIEITRRGQEPPTNGKGEAQFARMYPTETQPRESLLPLIRRHHGYLLQWQKEMRDRPGGMAGLPGLRETSVVSKYQDAEDLRGAEQELRKEVEFLEDANAKKFEVLDDPLLGKVDDAAAYGRFLPLPFMFLLGTEARKSMRSVMEEKQHQWDNWLKEDWAGDGALPIEKREAAHRLFEHYVHDSRAWFKALLRADKLEMAPNDEDWFVLGGREAERKKRVRELSQELERHQKAGDTQAFMATRQALQQMQQEGQPLIPGGREPYRLWGYLRHRRIYQTGRLADASFQARQQVIDREEQERQRQARRERMIAGEKARHEAELKRIDNQANQILLSGRLSGPNEQEYREATAARRESEKNLHANMMRRIEQETAPPAPR